MDTNMNEELKVLLQQVGDRIADVIEQMRKGNWTDDHGYKVYMNSKMIDLAEVLREIAKYRSKYLGYPEVF